MITHQDASAVYDCCGGLHMLHLSKGSPFNTVRGYACQVFINPGNFLDIHSSAVSRFQNLESSVCEIRLSRICTLEAVAGCQRPPVFPVRECSSTRGLPLLWKLLVLDGTSLVVLCPVTHEVKLVKYLRNSKLQGSI